MGYEDEKDNIGTQPLDQSEAPAAPAVDDTPAEGQQGGQDGDDNAPPKDAVEGVQPLTDDDIPEAGR